MDPSYSITKIDQGCKERYFGTIKHIRGHQPIVPAKHVLDSFKTVLANSIMFKKSAKPIKKPTTDDCKFLILNFENYNLKKF